MITLDFPPGRKKVQSILALFRELAVWRILANLALFRETSNQPPQGDLGLFRESDDQPFSVKLGLFRDFVFSSLAARSGADEIAFEKTTV
mgnify:CR=1 FL=1